MAQDQLGLEQLRGGAQARGAVVGVLAGVEQGELRMRLLGWALIREAARAKWRWMS
ncbi:hypothetical protein PtB15_11B666 [Puccinia triticina]|nr:hypothetical protein PtB15_11B666 [Puccinia triticina]